MNPPLLVLGATGNIGRPLVDALHAAGAPVRAASRTPGPASASARVEQVAFDTARPETWAGAFADVETMFFLRPPSVSDVGRDLVPMLACARAYGVRHAVYLSVQGAGRNRLLPHTAVETWLRGSGMGWTFVRPSYFMQNLSTVHAAVIRDRDAIVVPAGNGRTAFVDTHDVAAVAARAMLDPGAHAGRAWTPTGSEAVTYDEVAGVLSGVLGRRIRYTRPGVIAYARHASGDLHMPAAMVAVTLALYSTARLGLAAGLTGDVLEVTGRPPTGLREFAERERGAWERPHHEEKP